MAKYAPFGQAIFLETVFGIPPSDTFLVTAPSVTPMEYDALMISWFPLTNSIVGEQVLVRSSYGVPINISDGTVLLDEFPQQGFSASYLDENLRSGHFYYYAIFVLDENLNEYILTGAAQGLVLTNWAFGNQYMSWLPNYYSLLDADLPEQYPDVPPDNTLPSHPAGPLERFMHLLGYEMDWMRSEIESFYMLSNADLCSGAVLPFLGANLDMSYERSLGMTRSRFLIKNAVRLYKHRGTLAGVEAVATAYTGFPAIVGVGANQAIQLDDGAFDRSAGHWKPTNLQSTVTYASTTTPGSVAFGVTPRHVSYLPIAGFPTAGQLITQGGINGYIPPNNINVGVVSSNGAALSITTCNDQPGVINAPNLGLPISQLWEQATPPTPPTFVFSFFVMPAQQTTPALSAFQAQIDWYAQNGAMIRSTTGTAVTEVADTWMRVLVIAQPPTTPPFAYTFGLTIKSTADLHGTNHLIDAVKVETNTQATPGPTLWDPPRDIKIGLLPVRRNLIVNTQGRGVPPTFGWSTSAGATIVGGYQPATISWPKGVTLYSCFYITIGGTLFHVSPQAYGDEPYGGGASTGSAVGATTQSVSSPTVAAAGTVYTFSVWLMKTTLGSGQALIQIQFLNSTGTAIGSGYSQGLVLVSGEWAQGAVMGQAPLGTASAVATVQFVNAAGNDQFLMAAPMMEEVGAVRPYFDGNYAPSTDYLFEGTPNMSISDYFPGMVERVARLVTVMPDYIPMGSTFSILTGQQAITTIEAGVYWGGGVWNSAHWGGS